MNGTIYSYHVSWYAKKDDYKVDGFGHWNSSVLIAPLYCYLHFVAMVRADVANQLNKNDKIPSNIRYTSENVKLISINYLGEYLGDMEER